ncbi:hypothetical protein CENSYa_2062 [Cenarchaeum symbiosum A]|uniref:Transposase DDE domain-containing protein n=1 Tax=Cenarchaeum symbiosum (strain A) TaxID=414004 RepID=A0RZ98_CENSY|nr:hypothetical protein CENSYa_2062 [Cenarchaeum symbiosum A]
MEKPVGYNYSLVDRVVGLMNDVYKPNWDEKLAGMNQCKEGRPYRHPDGLILSLAKVKVLLRMTYRTTMVFLKNHLLGRSTNYMTIYRCICHLHAKVLRIEPGMKIVFVVDSSGLRVEHGANGCVQNTARATRGRSSSCTSGPTRTRA